MLRKPQCIDDGQGHKTGRGLSAINVERRTHRLNPGLCEAGVGVKGGTAEAEEERGREPRVDVSERRAVS